MKTLTLKPQHQDSVIGQLLALKSQLQYHKYNIAPSYYDMEEWETKEYRAVLDNNQAEFDNLKKYIISNEAIFNELLCQYNLSVAVFVYKFLMN